MSSQCSPQVKVQTFQNPALFPFRGVSIEKCYRLAQITILWYHIRGRVGSKAPLPDIPVCCTYLWARKKRFWISTFPSSYRTLAQPRVHQSTIQKDATVDIPNCYLRHTAHPCKVPHIYAFQVLKIFMHSLIEAVISGK